MLLKSASDISLVDLDFDSRSQECKKTQTSAPYFFCVRVQSFQSIWMEFGVPLRLVSVMNLLLILSSSCGIQGREPYLCDIVNKKL